MHLIIGPSHNGTLERPLPLLTKVCLPRSNTKRRSKTRKEVVSSAVSSKPGKSTGGIRKPSLRETSHTGPSWYLLSSRGAGLSCRVLVGSTPCAPFLLPSTQRTFPPPCTPVLFAPLCPSCSQVFTAVSTQPQNVFMRYVISFRTITPRVSLRCLPCLCESERLEG